MKMFSKCTISALAVSAVVVLALLSGGCDKNLEKPSDDGLLGTWSAEFEEEELCGHCIVNYSFNEGGTGIFSLVSGIDDEDIDPSSPILWRVDGKDKLCIIPECEKEIYDNLEMEWPAVTFMVSDKTLLFVYDDHVVAFNKTN